MTEGTPAARDAVEAADSTTAGDMATTEGDLVSSCAGRDPELKEKEVEDERDVVEKPDEVDDGQKAKNPQGGVPNCEYSWGIHDGTLLWMFILIVLLNLFMLILPLPGLRTDDPVSAKVWKISLLVCAHLFVMTIPTTRKAACVPSLLTSISYGPLLAFAAFDLIGPHAGITIVHLSTAWAAGTFGHSLAQYRLHEGTEDAATVAVARTPTGLSKKQRWQHLETQVYCFVTSSFLTLCFVGRVLWLLFVPSYEDNVCVLVAELSVLLWTALYFWLIILSPLMLHGALVRRVLWAYFFGLEMMIMAGVIGYSLAVVQHYKGMLEQKIRRPYFIVRPRRKRTRTVATRRHFIEHFNDRT
ncbi:hypothetical protein EJB05_29472, partial [Eragrostis curvula]